MKNKRKTHCLVATAFIMTVSLFAQDPETLSIGAAAPPFSLMGIDGKTYSLDSFRDAELLMVVFTANHCPTAQAYEQRLIRLAADYAPEKMSLVAISSNHPMAVCLEELGYTDLGDSFEEMKIRAGEKEYNFPFLYDGEDQSTALEYGAKATPHVFIFDRDRKLRYTGRIDDTEDPYKKPGRQDARNAINALLKGDPVPVETTKAFGCSMKWKSKMAWRQKLDEDWKNLPVSLELLDEEGLKKVLGNSEGTLTLVNFWATWCGPCVIEFPELVNLHRMYGQRGFQVISVSVDKRSQEDKVRQFLDSKEAAFKNYLYTSEDQEGMIGLVDPRWQGNLPYTLLIGPGGKAIYRHDGIIDPLEVKKQIISQLGRYYADD
jgi:thiol-disulfide isomerase/thioredoxin